MTDTTPTLIFSNDIPLDTLNTFGLPARAAHFATVNDVAALIHWARFEARRWPMWYLLGGGSNVVIRREIEAAVLRMCLFDRALVAEDAEAWYVRAGAGESWHDFVCWTLARGYCGLENLALIPGTVGAAPVQNIGAYGLELCDRFHTLEAVDLHNRGETRTFDRQACGFGYRDSVFKQACPAQWAITAVTFKLPKRWQPVVHYPDVAHALAGKALTPQAVCEAVMAIRRAKLPDPARRGNAGSFFQNPIVSHTQFQQLIADHPQMPHYPQPDGRVKLAAGWLIEQCGWKGRSIGPVGVSDKQALVLVNNGGATGEDVLKAAHILQAAVQDHFHVPLTIEPVIWPSLATHPAG